MQVNSQNVADASAILEAAASVGMKAEVIENPAFAGYRKLNAEETDLVNEIKKFGIGLGDMVAEIADTEADKRWLGIAATHFQQGLMAAVRSVTKPTTFA